MATGNERLELEEPLQPNVDMQNQVETDPTETDIQKEGEADTETSGTKRKGRAKSVIWDHFTRKANCEPDKPKAACNYCGAEYAADTKKNGTSTMLGHLRNCEKNPHKVQDKKQKVLAFVKKTDRNEEVSDNSGIVPWTKEGFRKSLAKYIILDELPFRHVEGEGFQQYSMYMNPRFVAPSRVTVGRDIYQLFLEEKEKLKKVLRDQRLCITTDTWTSIQNINYMAVTAHWIGDDWILRKRIINFIQVPNHKGDTIAKELVDCLSGWGISKLFTITVDNASSNDVAISKIKARLKDRKNSLVLGGNLLHMRCVCHIVNLVVGDGLKELSPSIASIRNAVRYVRSSPSRLRRFKECAKEERIESRALLCLDVATRWNSTYLMLDAATKYEKAFDRLDEDQNYKIYFDDTIISNKPIEGPPVSSDWEKARVFLKFLKLFYDLTLRFSGSLYVTSNLCFVEICGVKEELNALAEEEEESILSRMAIAMNLKFDKYWGNPEKVNHLVFIATLLDPRYKMELVKHCLGVIYPRATAEAVSTGILTTLYTMFDEYNSSVDVPAVRPAIAKTQSLAGASLTSEEAIGGGGTKNKVLRSWHAQKQGTSGGGLKNEVDKYLKEDCEDLDTENFDVLMWWKVNSPKYKVLSRIARDVLAVPVSTIASESAFSTGGRILDPFRSSLAPNMVEALICTKNWLSSKNEVVIDVEYPHEVESYKDSVEVVSDEGLPSTTTTTDTDVPART